MQVDTHPKRSVLMKYGVNLSPIESDCPVLHSTESQLHEKVLFAKLSVHVPHPHGVLKAPTVKLQSSALTSPICVTALAACAKLYHMLSNSLSALALCMITLLFQCRIRTRRTQLPQWRPQLRIHSQVTTVRSQWKMTGRCVLQH